MDKKFVITGILLVGMILSGLWLSRTGKPLNTVLLTIHKLVSLATLIFLIVTILQIHRVTPLSPFELGISLLAGLLFLALIATGGLLSTGNPIPPLVHQIHRYLPYVLLLSAALDIYLVLPLKP
ncbi:MAG: hypothetical protein GYA15_07000 [Leptolinea sp.]|jgi:hypothetical protein|nr:hypothetical protein [Leptolinea sp.]